MVFCSCASVTVPINTAGKDIEVIERERLPLSAPGAIEKAYAKDGVSDVESKDIGSGSITIDYSRDDMGLVYICADLSTEKKLKAALSKGDAVYYYNLQPFEASALPLQMGSGVYTVSLYENMRDTQYQKLYEDSFNFSLYDPDAVFLHPNQMVRFDNASLTNEYAKKLIYDLNDDTQKTEAIYAYIITHIRYDYNKAADLNSGYIPDADEILQKGRGICFDYAVLMAVLLREAGIPAKLVMGYKNGLATYHAWNEVYLNGGWVTMDATIDAALSQSSQPNAFTKDASQYQAEKVY